MTEPTVQPDPTAADLIAADLTAAIVELASRTLGGPPDAVELEPLRGGLIAPAVRQVTVRWHEDGRSRSWRLVAKRLPAGDHRELVVHRRLATRLPGRLAPGLFGSARLADGGTVLFLEWIRPVRRWPWTEHGSAVRATRALGRVHEELEGMERPEGLAVWDYEAELAQSARRTLEIFDQVPRSPRWRLVLRVRPAVERLVESLPELRRQLLADASIWIHGDVHPGNVVVGRHQGESQPTFLDWGRLRRGSPLEDLSSWLLSLGHWEPRVARRHDRLVAEYLRAADRPAHLGPSFRDAYWLAAASNALSGALRYQMLAALHATRPAERERALGAAAKWARAIRRADGRWRGPVAVEAAAGGSDLAASRAVAAERPL